MRVLSRRSGPDHVVRDLRTGQDLTAALSEVDIVLHLGTTLRGRTDVAATRNLVAAAAGVKHLVFMSIVGIDRIPIGYYKGKLAAEELVAGFPHTILRATQFHDLVYRVLAGAAKLPVMPLPRISFHPVDVRDVATQLVELAQGGAGLVQLFGPRTFYDDFPLPASPWVSLLPPYNEHLMRDVGALTLALVLVLAAAAIWPERRLVQVALAANLMFTVPHFLFHATHVGHYPTGTAIVAAVQRLFPATANDTTG